MSVRLRRSDVLKVLGFGSRGDVKTGGFLTLVLARRAFPEFLAQVSHAHMIFFVAFFGELQQSQECRRLLLGRALGCCSARLPKESSQRGSLVLTLRCWRIRQHGPCGQSWRSQTPLSEGSLCCSWPIRWGPEASTWFAWFINALAGLHSQLLGAKWPHAPSGCFPGSWHLQSSRLLSSCKLFLVASSRSAL